MKAEGLMNFSKVRELNPEKAIPLLAVGCYWIPLVLFVLWAHWASPEGIAWSAAIGAFFLACFGSVMLILTLRVWEAELGVAEPAPVVEVKMEPPPPPAPVAVVDDELQAAFEKVTDEKQQLLEKVHQAEAKLAELAQRNQEISAQCEGVDEDHARRDALLREYQETITEQRAIIDKKQHYISKLELKIQDLNYEVKTLLQLGDMGGVNPAELPEVARESHPVLEVFQGQEGSKEDIEQLYTELPTSSEGAVHTAYDASMQLNRYLEIAKKITGASHLSGGESRFSDLSVDSYAIDLRRLYESFRSESTCTLFLYSEKEERMLFVNDHIKALLGWSADRFVKDFFHLIQQGQAEWKHALGVLKSQPEAQVRLIMKDRNGHDVFLHCHVGQITEGVFADHTVGVLYAGS